MTGGETSAASRGSIRSARIRPTKLASRRAGDEVVVLDLTASAYHALNQSGGLLWEHLTDWTTTAELTALLVDAFGLTTEAAAQDVDRFVDQCARAGVVEIRLTPSAE